MNLALKQIIKTEKELAPYISFHQRIDESNSNIVDENSYFDLISDFDFNNEWIKNNDIQQTPDWDPQICPVCNFHPSTINQSFYTSSKRDLVMTIYVKHMDGMIILARSLRTTSCKASIVYFVDSNLYSEIQNNTQYYKFFQGCGISLINFGKPPLTTKSVVNYRFILFGEFIKHFYNNYNKVIITDGFDTVFQSDPFGYEWDPKAIYLTRENQLNIVTESWYKELFHGENVFDVLNTLIVNNGVVAGYSEAMYRYLDFYLNEYDWKKWNHPYDQAHLNYLFYRKKFKRNGIKIIAFYSCEGFISSIYQMHGNESFQKLGVFNPKNRKFCPSLIHKYSEAHEFAINTYKQCPRLAWQRGLNEYIQGVTQEEMSSLDNLL